MARAGLNRTIVSALAADVADETGWAGLTLAAVAARAGVRVPSLYKHVGSLSEVRRDVSVIACRELLADITRAAVGRSGPEALREIAGAYRDYAHRHPGRYLASVIAPAPADTEHQAVAAELLHVLEAVFAGTDLPDDDRVHAIRGLRAAMHGFVSLEAAGGFALPQDLDVSYDRLVDAFTAPYTSLRATP